MAPKAPTEFGFTTGPYVPPARPRPFWRTLLFSALLTLIPVVGPGMSAVYVDRREDPESYDTTRALVTAVIQLVAVAIVAAILWVVLVVVLGLSIQFTPQVTAPAT
ncbi:MAG: hypothetical protein KC442_16230 [Thermomicrobiales bacterium]|nr:hypothetical protein [Thermomicrobiales bacterium]